MKLPFRPLPLLISGVLMAALYWGLSQADSRAIYAGWDKLLHAAVFFLAWWLLRWCLRGSWFWISLLAVLAGGTEEIHQLFVAGHQADWGDWYADIAGVALALAIYGAGRLLWLLRESVADARASRRTAGEGEATAIAPQSVGHHAVDWRLSLKLWRWEYYLVLLAGHERRALSRREQEIARWTVGLLIVAFLAVSAAAGLLVLYLIKLALGA